ncbi:hypothetical protein RE428_32190 [Marinobacter nanhaiticus D15-8W]|uniref:XRE family transcriptional regulator n=1 Tax=Marinobacter nanhaiticus D15-8W TaxID=626887 RepID=N6WZC6_9GAMM|nr:hypothetical protein J057_01865 [Marinobacter nanhaiticus D15-8W]BES72201.1 hypothetical protein RE428_32190 [Marinobacter nanhaiticus D15-8W]
MDSILIQKTITGLRLAKGEFRAIAEEAGVDYSWLSKFSRSVFPDPSGRRVERVYRALLARRLVEPVIDFGETAKLKDCA